MDKAKIVELVTAALDQLEILPVFDPPRGNTQWLVNNQRKWALKYINDALDELGQNKD